MVVVHYCIDECGMLVYRVVCYLSFHVPQLAAVPLHLLPIPLYILRGCLTGLHTRHSTIQLVNQHLYAAIHHKTHKLGRG